MASQKKQTSSGSDKQVFKISDNAFDFGQFYFSYAKYHYNDVYEI